MTKISKEELLKIAAISKLKVYEDEIPALQAQVEEVLTYAERVKEIVTENDIPSSKKMNVFREDVVISTNEEDILKQAPEQEQDFFVVPMILEK